jgi:hypothetical protein
LFYLLCQRQYTASGACPRLLIDIYYHNTYLDSRSFYKPKPDTAMSALHITMNSSAGIPGHSVEPKRAVHGQPSLKPASRRNLSPLEYTTRPLVFRLDRRTRGRHDRTFTTTANTYKSSAAVPANNPINHPKRRRESETFLLNRCVQTGITE